MELFARFLLDRRRIGLQGLDLVHVLSVFLLEMLDFAPQLLQLGSLLAINHHAVGAEHGVQQQSDKKQSGDNGSQATPLQNQPTPCWARAFNPTRSSSLSLRGLIFGMTHRMTYGMTYGLADGLPHPLIHSLTVTCRPTEGRSSAWKDAHCSQSFFY
jgi:hypothetical protein